MRHNNAEQSVYDAVIIGSGFGGSMVAHALLNAGKKVLMIERGDWVKRGPQNWEPYGTLDLTPFYNATESLFRAVGDGRNEVVGVCNCVGGPSVFFGGVAMRFREKDFMPDHEITCDSGAHWPYSYRDLEPYYTRAEKMLDVAGETGCDPTEPFRSTAYPQKLNELSHTSRMVERAALSLGLSPFRLPLAINYSSNREQAQCVACTTCDTFACAIHAKNDLATCVLPELIKKGLQLKVNTVATRLVVEDSRLVAVECYDKTSGERKHYDGKLFILSAGALASPHLLLASDLARFNPGGHNIGHYLMRHCNAIAFGFFLRQPNKARQFHKQLGIHDFYFGHPTIRKPSGKLGCMQQLQTPPVGLVKAVLPKPLGQILSPVISHLTGMLVMAEDQPRYGNHVAIDWRTTDRFGLPQLTITHRYSERDYEACHALIKKAKEVLRKAGALFSYVHKIKTFSHAVGSVRMGNNPSTSALDPFCKFRGLQNLYVVDGSFMPTSAGVNPSLTIAANALRVGEHLTTISV